MIVYNNKHGYSNSNESSRKELIIYNNNNNNSLHQAYSWRVQHIRRCCTHQQHSKLIFTIHLNDQQQFYRILQGICKQ